MEVASVVIRPTVSDEADAIAAVHRAAFGSDVEAAVTLARESGEVAILVFGDPAYYGRFGFTDAQAKGVRTPHPAEPEWGWQILELAPGLLGPPGVLQVAAPLDDPAMWRE